MWPLSELTDVPGCVHSFTWDCLRPFLAALQHEAQQSALQGETTKLFCCQMLELTGLEGLHQGKKAFYFFLPNYISECKVCWTFKLLMILVFIATLIRLAQTPLLPCAFTDYLSWSFLAEYIFLKPGLYQSSVLTLPTYSRIPQVL